jgi:hypothetical protein
LAGGRLSREEILAYLETYEKVVAAYLKELYSQGELLTGPENLHGRISLSLGVRGYESELEWTRWAAAEIKRAGRVSRKPRPSR